MVADPREREEIEKEEETLRVIALFGKTNREQAKALEEKDKALAEQAERIAELGTPVERKMIAGCAAEAFTRSIRRNTVHSRGLEYLRGATPDSVPETALPSKHRTGGNC
jgi:hypothetical protein